MGFVQPARPLEIFESLTNDLEKEGQQTSRGPYLAHDEEFFLENEYHCGKTQASLHVIKPDII